MRSNLLCWTGTAPATMCVHRKSRNAATTLPLAHAPSSPMSWSASKTTPKSDGEKRTVAQKEGVTCQGHVRGEIRVQTVRTVGHDRGTSSGGGGEERRVPLPQPHARHYGGGGRDGCRGLGACMQQRVDNKPLKEPSKTLQDSLSPSGVFLPLASMRCLKPRRRAAAERRHRAEGQPRPTGAQLGKGGRRTPVPPARRDARQVV
jgi:hypothetical protein